MEIYILRSATKVGMIMKFNLRFLGWFLLIVGLIVTAVSTYGYYNDYYASYNSYSRCPPGPPYGVCVARIFVPSPLCYAIIGIGVVAIIAGIVILFKSSKKKKL
jgi:succinate dehydrogenase/fumarate reductase cytochrome b subunit